MCTKEVEASENMKGFEKKRGGKKEKGLWKKIKIEVKGWEKEVWKNFWRFQTSTKTFISFYQKKNVFENAR